MSPPTPADTEVLIAGAGPTGLMLALWLARRGARVQVVDPKPGPSEETRAIVVQARTLEFYDQLGVGEAALARGRHFGALQLWVDGEERGQLRLGDAAADLTPHPYLYILTQDQNQALLIAALRACGVDIAWGSRLADFTQDDEGVTAQIEREGRVTALRARYLVGCDGGRSGVRQKLDVGFAGGTSSGTFFVADTTATGQLHPDDLNLLLNHDEFFAVFPMPGRHRHRVVGILPEGAGNEQDAPDAADFEAVRPALEAGGILKVQQVHWFSTYRVHHRVAAHFRAGRVFLAGDAGHIHSPLGGQGMNTGLGDAVNLGWKLAQALRCGDPTPGHALLDSYEAERIPFARALIASTDRAFRFIGSTAPRGHLIRTRLVPTLLPTLARLQAVRRQLFLRIAQTRIRYPKSPLSQGRAAQVQGGDRLPWVKSDPGSNFVPLQSLDWQMHVYGRAPAELQRWCDQRALPLHVFPFTPAARHAGLAEDAPHLIRPDGHVGLVLAAFNEEALDDYAKRWLAGADPANPGIGG